MITLRDLDNNKVVDKYGFQIVLSAEALDELLRKHFNMPEGEVSRLVVNGERNMLQVIYRSDRPRPGDKYVAGRIPEVGEIPHRFEPKDEG